MSGGIHPARTRQGHLAAVSEKYWRRLKAVATDPLNTWPSPPLSRAIFGNTAGMSGNLRGRFDLSRARLGNPVRPNTRYAEYARRLVEDGLTFVPGAYAAGVVERAAEGCRALYERGSDPNARLTEIDGTVYRTHHLNPHLRVLGFADLLDDRVNGILKAFYRCRFEIFLSGTWRNLHVPETVMNNREAYSNRWHCDTFRISVVKLFIVLNEVTDKDGPFHIMPRRATHMALKKGYVVRENYGGAKDFMADPKNFTRLVGPPGTAILCRTSACFHRAGIPEAGRYRDIAEIRFRPVVGRIG